MRARVYLALLCLLLVLVGLASPAGYASTAPGRYPVVFIPGLASTELYNHDDLLWFNAGRLAQSYLPFVGRQALAPLGLDATGEKPAHSSYRIRTGDVLRRVGLVDVYGGFLTSMQAYGYREGRNLVVVPYDWRKDATAQVAAVDAAVQRVLAANPGSNQVILIGHSLGGLIARDYMVRTGGRQVRGLVAMGTPWLGTPVAYKALRYGLGLRLPGTGLALEVGLNGAMKGLLNNWPSMYQLTPGPGYWQFYKDGYLVRDGRPLDPTRAVEEALVPSNPRLARYGASYTPRLLDGNSYGVEQFLLVGYGYSTLTAIRETTNWLGFVDRAETFGDGDEQVPLYSADLGHSLAGGRPEHYLGKISAVGYVKADHVYMTASRSVQQAVGSWIVGLK